MSRSYRCLMASGLGLALLMELTWEAAQTPLYGGWGTIPWPQLAGYVIQGTAGDLLTLAVTYLLTALICRDRLFFRRVSLGYVLFTLLGVIYTVASEYVNVQLLHRWSYAPMMPMVPVIDTGLAPLMQWLLLPPALLWILARLARRRSLTKVVSNGTKNGSGSQEIQKIARTR